MSYPVQLRSLGRLLLLLLLVFLGDMCWSSLSKFVGILAAKSVLDSRAPCAEVHIVCDASRLLGLMRA